MERTATTPEGSLLAAIEGDYAKMSHRDLLATVGMLSRGRAIWRAEAEAGKALLEQIRVIATGEDNGLRDDTQALEEIAKLIEHAMNPLREVAAPADRHVRPTV